MSITIEHIHQSNLIEGFNDPLMDNDGLVVWRLLSRLPEIDPEIVKVIHLLITLNQERLPLNDKGQWRKVQVYVADFMPPPFFMVEELMGVWCANINHTIEEYEKTGYKHPDITKELHVQFETIHPFRDGNGRTGRMLMWWHQARLDEEPLLIKNREKAKYYNWFDEGKR